MQFFKNYPIVPWLIVMAFILSLNACDDQPCPAPKTRIVTPPVATWQVGQGEVLYSGYIRTADWNRMTVTYESDLGYIKVIGPICGEGLPVWSGMHVNELDFHWFHDNNPGVNDNKSCFVIDYVLHSPTGDYKP